MSADLQELKLAKEVGRRDILFSLARLPESERLLIGSSDFQLYQFDLSAEQNDPQQEAAGHDSYVTGVAVAGQHLVTGGFDCRLVWRDLETLQPVRAIDEAHGRFIRDVRASPDGRFIVSVGDDMRARLWEAESGQLLHELHGHEEKTPHHYPSMLYACAISPDSRHVATVDRVGRIVVWDAASGAMRAELEAPEMYTWDPKQRRHSIGGIRSAAFSPDGRLLAVGGMGQVGNIDHLEGKARVEIFDWEKGERTHEYADNGFKGLVESLAFHPGGDWLLAAGGDNSGFLMFFDLDEPEASIKEEKAPMHIHAVALDEEATAIYAAGHGKVAKWELGG